MSYESYVCPVCGAPGTAFLRCDYAGCADGRKSSDGQYESTGPSFLSVFAFAVFLIALPVALFLALGSYARADGSGNCSNIRDRDYRNYCRALADGDHGDCDNIREPDLRNQCFARTQR